MISLDGVLAAIGDSLSGNGRVWERGALVRAEKLEARKPRAETNPKSQISSQIAICIYVFIRICNMRYSTATCDGHAIGPVLRAIQKPSTAPTGPMLT